MNVKILLVALFSSTIFSLSAQARPVKVCLEDSQWFPMIYKNYKGEISGVQVDIIKGALEKLNIKYSLNMLPWKRCLMKVSEGDYDAALGASYSDERSKYLYYPKNAKKNSMLNGKHNKRVAQSVYVAINLKSQNYIFDGNLSKVPVPVYIPAGFSIAEDLKGVGVLVDDGAKKDILNFKKLLRGEKGTVIAIEGFAKAYIESSDKKKFFSISSRSVKSKSNYLAFSKKSKIKSQVVGYIWDAIEVERKKNITKLYRKHKSY